ncbi:retrovirus-related pol polyprotein from transposon TNT 1-94 [Tanacetum coccineum]
MERNDTGEHLFEKGPACFEPSVIEDRPTTEIYAPSQSSARLLLRPNLSRKGLDALTENLKKQDNSDSICVNSNDCMSSDNLCVSNAVNVVKSRAKSKKRKSKKVSWKPTGKVFTQIGYIWRPTGRTFTIVGNACPLTRITTTNEVPSRKPIVLDSESPKPVVKLVYSRKPRKNTNAESVSKTKVVQIVLWYLDSGCSKHMTGDRSQLTNFVSKFLVAFRQHTCFIRNLEGVDLLTGSRGDNLYTLSLGNMMASSPICLLSKASKTKSWLWHRRLSHLNFGSINHLARHGLVRGIFINQSKYALESLKKYGYESCDPVDTPMVEKSKLDEDKEGNAVDPSHYRGMIGTCWKHEKCRSLPKLYQVLARS